MKIYSKERQFLILLELKVGVALVGMMQQEPGMGNRSQFQQGVAVGRGGCDGDVRLEWYREWGLAVIWQLPRTPSHSPHSGSGHREQSSAHWLSCPLTSCLDSKSPGRSGGWTEPHPGLQVRVLWEAGADTYLPACDHRPESISFTRHPQVLTSSRF